MMLKNFWTTLFWLLLAFCSWFLLREITPKPPPFPHFDKLLHATGFIGLTFSGLKGYPSKPAWILACMAIYGAGTEALQGMLTITRDASLLDWLADMAGVLVAYHFQKHTHHHGLRV